MDRTYPDLPWCRYADDGLVHCRTEQEAEAVKAALQARLAECQLEMHPTKTKIVYCKDSKRRGNVSERQRLTFSDTVSDREWLKNPQNGRLFCGFTPAVSSLGAETHAGDDPGLEHSARKTHRVAGRHRSRDQSAPPGVDRVLWAVYALGARRLAASRQSDASCVWVRRKFKRFAVRASAAKFLQRLAKVAPKLFVHWQLGIIGKFA